MDFMNDPQPGYDQRITTALITALQRDLNLPLGGLDPDVQLALKAVGEIIIWPNATAPPGYLLCDGSVYNTTVYPQLFRVLGVATLPSLTGTAPFTVAGIKPMIKAI